MQWIIEPEYIACVLIAIILRYLLLDRSTPTAKSVMFQISLFVSLAAILSNIASVYLISYAYRFPIHTLVGINTIYFILTPLMTLCVSINVLLVLFDGNYLNKKLLSAACILLGLYGIMLAIVALNGKYGWLFYFDANKNYIRGALNITNAIFLGCVLLVTAACFLMERRQISKSFRSIIITLELLGLVMASVQVAYPNTMLSGSAAALSLLVTFIYGQQQQIHMDHLTELHNRESFYRTMEWLSKKKVLLRVIIISLRDYKSVNKRYGQRLGDMLLHQVGGYLSELSPQAKACRFSGVEFAVIFTEIGEQEYETLFEQIQNRFKQPWILGEEPVFLQSAMADIAYPAHAKSINELIESMEYAVRLAKESNDGTPVRFSKELQKEYGRRNYVISQLEPGMKEGRFFLMFQPVVECDTEISVGGEALLRLREAGGQTVMPGEFIPLAEETGIVGSLGWYVLEEVCAFLSTHRESGIQWISVNLSEPKINRAEMVGRISDLLERYQLPGSMLKLEITERVLIQEIEEARMAIRELKDLGVGIYLDDFGTGYSNLANVMSLPLECVKVDKSLVSNVEQDTNARAMLATLVRGLKAMHLNVLTEGVETGSQRDIVHSFGVNRIQGFYYAKPMESEEFARYMEEQGEKENLSQHGNA